MQKNKDAKLSSRVEFNSKYIVKKIIAIFLCLFIAFWAAVLVQLVQDWKEFKSPHPIMIEYYRIRYFGSYKSWMISNGWLEDNILFKLLENQQKEDLEYIRSIVPKGDLLIDLLEWQIKFEPYFMHTLFDTYGKIYELQLPDWLRSIRFKKSHIKQIEEQEKFIYFARGVTVGLQNAGGSIKNRDAFERFGKSILPAIKNDNYFAKTVMQSLFVHITIGKITLTNKSRKPYTDETCENYYYPILIMQIQEWESYIEKLIGLTARERYIIKGYINRFKSEAQEIYEFNHRYCLKK